MWWRGMRFEITELIGDNKFRYESVNALHVDPDWVGRDGTKGRSVPAYTCISALAEALWDDEFGFWYLPYVTGEMPKAHITAEGVTEMVDPDVPTCICENTAHGHDAPHGAITHRLGPLCSECRIADGAAVAEVA